MKNYTYTKADGSESLRCLADLKHTPARSHAVDLTGLGPDECDVVMDAIHTYQKTIQKTIDAAVKEAKKGFTSLEDFVKEKTGVESKNWIKNFLPDGLKEIE